MAFGLDFVSDPPIADMKAAGVTFVCRYLSYVNVLTQVKLLTHPEALALSEAGIAIVSNYEWYANRALEGKASGEQDAQIAASQHSACGGPANRPIYFSVDVDVAGEQVLAYFAGIASVIGLSRTGAYGSYRVLKYLFDQGAITWGWQTYAWSDGAWEARAHIQQYQNGMTLGGHSVDYDRSEKSDFGQWTVGGGHSTMPQQQQHIPGGWRDAGGVLYSPNNNPGQPEVPVTGKFRDYILGNPWVYYNLALEEAHHVEVMEESNLPLGPGFVQTFRFARLIIPDSGKQAGQVLYSWFGIEFVHLQQAVAQGRLDLATLKNQVTTLTNELNQANAQIGQEQQEIASLKQEAAGLPDLAAIANRLSTIGLEAKQASDLLAEVQQQAAQPIQ